MTAPEPTTAELLGMHGEAYPHGCNCGIYTPVSLDIFNHRDEHRTHVAQVLDARRDDELRAAVEVRVQTTCVDPEEYARIFNAGYEAACAQNLADDPQFWEDWLSERDRATWEAGVDAAFRGAIMRQNADDVKRANPCDKVEVDTVYGTWQMDPTDAAARPDVRGEGEG